MFASRADNVSYRRSQAATQSPLHPSAVARGLALQVLSSDDEAAFRQRVAQHLVDELSQAAGLPPARWWSQTDPRSTATTGAGCR